jgi:hypothetical protein
MRALTLALVGTPTYNVYGWQKLVTLQDGYADTFQELLKRQWQNYGTESGNPKLPTAWCTAATSLRRDHTFSGLRGFRATASYAVRQV